MEKTLQFKTTDEGLWKEFKCGSEPAFGRIYRKHAGSLFSYGYRLTLDTNLIEDCIHDLFIELWRRRDHLSDIISIKHYLLRALDRKIKRRLSQERKKVMRNSNMSITNEMSFELRWINEQMEVETSQKLQKAIDMLSYRQKEVLKMHYYEGRDYTEIARVINIKYQSVANLMCQSIRKLRQGMKYAEFVN